MIYTLYSYKGGVGRSMALANLGAYFCSKGLRVVMVDWDLEAPGLENFFYSTHSSVEVVRAAARPGLIDLLIEYKNRFPELRAQARLENASTQPAYRQEQAAQPIRIFEQEAERRPAVTEEDIREAEEVARITREFRARRKAEKERGNDGGSSSGVSNRPVTFAEILDRVFPSVEPYLQSITTSGSSGLWLLSAGARSPESFARYADAVQDFDWLDFIASYEGIEYLEWLRRKLNAVAHMVLIDSRTGVTEMGGICTRQMADVVVALCAPNNQNLEGTERVVNWVQTLAARKARLDRNVEVVVVPTRVDDSESSLLGEFLTQFSARFEREELVPKLLGDASERPFWKLQIPYIPKYNYQERLVISPMPKNASPPDPPTEKLIQAYETIASHMALLAPADSPIRNALQSEIAGFFPELLPKTTPRITADVPGTWVERPDGARLKEMLLRSAAAPKGGRLAIWGPAGVGKTTLLARVCQGPEIAAAFPGGIIWLTLEGAWTSERVQDFLRTQFALPRGGGKTALAHALADRRFLFIVDDVWTADQIETVFEFGQVDTRVILTRDFGTASEFADSVFMLGKFAVTEAGALLGTTVRFADQMRADPVVGWLIDWPLGTSLLRAAVERQGGTHQVGAWDALRAQLQRSGLRLLDQPQVAARNGSIDRSLRESLSRLQPDARRLLFSLVAQRGSGSKIEAASRDASQRYHQPSIDRGKRSADRSPMRELMDLGLAVSDGEDLRADEIVQHWLGAEGDLTEDVDGKRRRLRKETLESGYAILRGKSASLSEMEQTAYRAKDLRAFSLARKLLALVRMHPDASTLAAARKLRLLQQHALCTYKDEDLVADERLTQAFQILNQADLQAEKPSQETLGLAGSIYKLRWRYTGQRGDLEQSLFYYQSGAHDGVAGDFGYTGINAAFVLDQIARLEQKDFPDAAKSRGARAAALREEIVGKLPDLAAQPANSWLRGEWWYGATMAESLFGLGRYSEARYWLREALALDPPAWQLESTTRQMASLAHAQGLDMREGSDPWRTIAMLVGDATDALHAITAGKIGLALSGGGFRASLFHIGVLARLAEIDVLRHVEVLSCVSGGSIVGAHYYLEVRRLLQEKRDREITREDYIQVVKRIERDFLAGVQKNLRSRLFAGWIANLKSLLIPGYTRTAYLGHLLEKHLYARVQDDRCRVLRKLQIRPKELQIKPENDGTDFNPKLDNWRRSAKAPILLLNATTLNTGHVWQFAVSWMGEPPISASSSVESNDILRRTYYWDAPSAHLDVSLGKAVAASACVPGLFDPVDMQGLFPRRSVRLVDGGVHDNQGIAGLLEQECSVMLVSDASGQMTSKRRPGAELVTVLKRTQDASMGRIREAEYRQLITLRNSSALAGLMFLHLKKDLEVQHIDWIGCQEPYESTANLGQVRRSTTLTTYGMPKTVQSLLAGLRTDLDTFSDAEAYSLMLSGYRMAAAEFPGNLPALSISESPPERWNFLAIEPTVDRATDYETEHERLQKVLAIGARLPLKVWSLRPIASAFTLLLALILLGVAGSGIAWIIWIARPWLESLPDYTKWISMTMAALCVMYVLGLWLRGRKSMTVVVTGLVIVTVGWLIARLHLWFFDPLYRGAGAVRERDIPRTRAEPR
jgi:predicted acylesterase/phospholipase RssA/MinD-like ATPase involved in chromosome partitioning or flagellar assembly